MVAAVAPTAGAVEPSDDATTIVGDPPLAAPPDGEGLPAEVTNLYDVTGIAVHPWTGEVYWSDRDLHRIRRLDSDGRTWTVAGDGTAGFAGDGGDAFEARFDRPGGISFDGDGNLFIADTHNHRIRRIDTLGFISTVAGGGVDVDPATLGDFGIATAAELAFPFDVEVHETGRFFYIADSGNHRVRRANLDGIITTVAGTSNGFSGDFGPANEAQLSFPEAIALDPLAGRLYISDLGNQRVRVITEGNRIVTLAGNGDPTTIEGALASETGVGAVRGLAVDYFGNLHMTDHGSDTVRIVTTASVIETISGLRGGLFGTAANETYLNPTALTFDRLGRLLVGDETSIVRIAPATSPPTVPRANPYGRPGEDQVRRLYRAAFDRVPEAGGLRFWVERYQGDDTMLTLAANFIASGESIAIYGEDPTDEEFLTIVYTNVLGRGPDGGGLAFWLNQLDEGRTRASVLAAFADSPENIELSSTAPPMTAPAMEVLRLYRAAFGRVPDAGGLEFWVGQRNGGSSLTNLAGSFIASPEASGYLDTAEDSLFVEALYGNVLNRNADDPGLLFWLGQLTLGQTRAEVLVAFSESPENRQNTGTA